MVRKTEELYNRILDVLVAGRNFNHTVVISDFELAAINSFKAHFPRATVHGCFFHLCQSVWRRVQAQGLQDRYKNDPNFRIKVKMIASLAFVPIADVADSFDLLRQLYGEDMLIFSKITMYIRSRNRHRQARFPLQLWNCHQLTLDGFPRTNNNAIAVSRQPLVCIIQPFTDLLKHCVLNNR